MKRRGRGEGAVYQRSRDGRWVAVLDLGWRNGKRVRRQALAASQATAYHKLAELRRQYQKDKPVPPPRLTVARFLEDWLRDVAAPTLRLSTYTRYRELLTLHAMPVIGRTLVIRLSPQDLNALYADRLEAGLAAMTVRHLHRVLHRALADAVRWGIVRTNPAEAVTPPRVKRQETRYLTLEQAAHLLAAAEGDPLEALYVVALTGGLRQGELLALTWDDVDLEAGTVRVVRSIRRIRGQGWHIDEPKSDRSRRTVHLVAQAVEALRAHRKRQLEHRLTAVFWDDRGLVFPNSIGRPIESTNLIRRSFHALLERAGLPRLRFHDLRHTAASLLLAQGTHPKVVQEMLGHASISLTLDVYSHLVPSLQKDAVARLEAALWRARL